MKKKIINGVFVIVFLFGLSLLLYPYISNLWNEYRQSKLITEYGEALIEHEEVDYSSEWEAAKQYNQDLLPQILPDAFVKAEMPGHFDEVYMSCLDLTGDGMMGYVEIPKIDVKIPVYHTTKEDVLEKAAGHIEGSSLPVGGESTHAVVLAHRGLPNLPLFTDLDRVDIGDRFLLYVLDDVLCYEVDHIVVVEPGDTQNLAIEEGKDLVTLMTCTPYGVNSHRLLVRGHRVEYELEVLRPEENPKAEVEQEKSLHTNYLFWVVAGLMVTGAVILVIGIHDHRGRKKTQGNGFESNEKLKK